MVSDCGPESHLNSTKSDSARAVAYEAFVEINRRGGYSNILLPKLLTNSQLDRRDRAFVTELVYGATRMLGRNDYIAAKFSKVAWAEVDPEIVDSVRLGAYQILDMRTPVHAAVSATVEVAKKYIGQSRASFVNAILRRISEKSLTEHLIDAPDDARYSHPNWIISAYKDLIKDQVELVELLECNNSAVKPTLVAWPSKSTPNELPGNPTKYSPYGVHSSAVPQEIEAIRNRSAGVQDEGVTCEICSAESKVPTYSFRLMMANSDAGSVTVENSTFDTKIFSPLKIVKVFGPKPRIKFRIVTEALAQLIRNSSLEILFAKLAVPD